MNLNKLSCCAALLFSAGIPVVSHAATITTTLDQLLATQGNPNPTLVEGDKIYSDFTYLNPGPLAANHITVTLTDDAAANHYTLRFQGGLFAKTNQITDLVIGYTVSVASFSTDVISHAGLVFNGAVLSGSGAASVVDTITVPGDPTPVVAPISVFNDGPNGLKDNLSTGVDLPGARAYHFSKDILIQADPTGGFVAISTIDQSVDETPGLTAPEPTAGMLLLGGAGSLLMSRRRRA